MLKNRVAKRNILTYDGGSNMRTEKPASLEIHNLYSSPNMREIKLRRWTGYVAYVEISINMLHFRYVTHSTSQWGWYCCPMDKQLHNNTVVTEHEDCHVFSLMQRFSNCGPRVLPLWSS
jgi:hypothetical protein